MDININQEEVTDDNPPALYYLNGLLDGMGHLYLAYDMCNKVSKYTIYELPLNFQFVLKLIYYLMM